MRLIPPRAWMLIVLSAALQFLCFPIAGQISPWREGICWFSLAPLFVALTDSREGGKPLAAWQGALLGYVCGVIWYASSCYWIYQTMYLYGGLPKPVALVVLLLFALYLGLYHALFSLLFVCLRRSRLGITGTLFVAPCLWVAVELLRARLTGFPWDLLGNTLVDHSWLIRIAPVGGVMALSFSVAAINAVIAYAATRPKISGVLVTACSALLVVVLQVSGIGASQIKLDLKSAPAVAVMMQENLSVGATAREEKPLTREEELKIFSAWSMHPTVPGQEGDGWSFNSRSKSQTTLIVWPEAPAHFFTSDAAFLAGMRDLAQHANVPVISGSIGVVFDKAPARGYYEYDSAALFDRNGGYQGRYDKIHLVPWGEYVPYKEIFSFAQKLTAGAGDMDPGHARTVFRIDGHNYGVFVCYESIFGDEVRQFVKNGAEVLVNISDDGWYGDTGAPWQHLNMARMRAIENHRWVIRSTNTGLTTTIDPNGRYTETPRHVRVAYALPFEFQTDTTFYTRHGDWFAYLCAVVSAVGLAFSFSRRVPAAE